MGSEVGGVEERLMSFWGQLLIEYGILDRIVYKNKNQHRRCFYFQHLLKVRRDLRLLQSAKLEEILNFSFLMVEPMLETAVDISKLVQSFFMGFSVTILSMLARLRVLVQQILLDAVCVYNTISSVSQKELAIKVNEEGFEVFREYYPMKEQFISLECIWQTDQGAFAVQYQNIEVLLGGNDK
ncbi:hypothetical protein ACH5RR_025361 [Cinchona calisaya]|uniref:Nucleolus and neural progenitor protein-like N-terminal domain-containing protein n=1 Tax=Cinchona calisaya TaxID=153742 RepID=A0ABD2Z0I1_9GENT